MLTQDERAKASPGPAGNGSRPGLLRFSMAQCLGALIMLLVTAPFVEQLPNGTTLEAGLMTLVMLSAVLAVGARRQTLIAALLLVVPAFVGKWLNHFRPDLVPAEIYLTAGLIFMGFMVLQFLRFILRAPKVNSEVLCAGVCGYLMMGILWGLAYLLVARIAPGSFAFTVGPVPTRSMIGFSAIYFSFVTLATVGYGDIIPISGVTRMLAIVEATAGMFYVTVLISRLVALYSKEASEQPEVSNGDEVVRK